MSQQKAFYEIEKPTKKTYSITIAEIDEKAPLQCQHKEPIFNKAKEIIGYLTCCDTDTMSNDVYECPCCGLLFCDDHLSKKCMRNEFLCQSCAEFPMGDIEKMQAFRLDLNR